MRLSISKALLGTAMIAALAAAAACGGGGETSATPTGSTVGRLRVVATTTQIADLARNVAGDRAEVASLVGPNQDPHEFEPRPDQLRALDNANLVLRHGLGLDHFADKPLGSVSKEKVVVVTAGVRLIQDDPHVWFDVDNAKIMAANVRDALVKADAANAGRYRANADAYLKELDQLNAFVRSETDRVPRGCRKLVTDHEVLTYYAAAYGFEIVDTVIPGSSTEAEPSARDIATAVERIRSSGVPAVFAQASANPQLMERVAREAGVKVVTGIYADSLGPPGSDGDTYIKMLRANTGRIVGALEGCRG